MAIKGDWNSWFLLPIFVVWTGFNGYHILSEKYGGKESDAQYVNGVRQTRFTSDDKLARAQAAAAREGSSGDTSASAPSAAGSAGAVRS